MRRLLLLLSIMLLVPSRRARAQDTATVHVTPDSLIVQLTLRDGSVLVGRVVDVTPTSIRFLSGLGESTIPRSAIASLRVLEKERMRDGVLWPEDPSRTRLLFSPTGRMMHQGESYLADAYVFFPSLQFGVTDLFSIGVGASLIPGLDLDQNVFFITPKLGLYRSPRLNVAVGALIAGARGLSDVSPVGLGYGVATIGDENDSFTVGGAFGFANGETSSLGLLMLGGSTRTTKNIALVSENYLAVGSLSSSLFSGGVQFIGDKVSVDLALWGGPDTGFVVPYVAFIYRF